MLRLTFRQVVILVSTAVSIFYLVYRAAFTLNLTSPYATVASLFLFVGEFYGVITMLLYFLQVWDITEPPQQPVLQGRTVDVFVPTYNEDPDLLRVTLRACVAMQHPHKTYLCDDGGTEARLKDPVKGPPSAERAALLKAICDEVGAIYCTRPENSHAKAGNLNYAFTQTNGEFIIIFDADHVPDPNFITRLIGYFADDRLGFVQTPHAFYNFESFQARLNHARQHYWEEGQLFYHVLQPGRNYWNAPIFAGSAAMFRRKALQEVGFIATETITEDMHTGLRMHVKGWRSLGISCRMISGQAAQDVTTFHSQRLRWGEGNLSVLAHDNPLTIRGLNWGQRLCYLATMINWCGGMFKLPIYLTPLFMLITGIPPVREFNWVLAIIMVAYMSVSILGTKYVSNGYGSVWYSELFTMASFWTQVRGTMRAIFMRKFQMFVVTAKRGRQSKSIWPYIRPQVYLILLSAMALLWAWGRLWFGISDDYFKPVLATFWTFFHMLLAYLVVRRAYWPEERRYSTRHTVHLPVSYEQDGQSVLLGPDNEAMPRLGVTIDLNERGIGFLTYERLAEDKPVRLTIYAPGSTVSVEGIVKFGRPLAGGPVGVYRYGLEFKSLDVPSTDALYHICLQYAVPRLYAYYGEGHRDMPVAVKGSFAKRFFRRRFTARHEFHLPLFLRPEGEQALPTVTEDLSRTSAAVLLHDEIMPGTEIPFTLPTPAGVVSGRARVLRNTRRTYAARVYFYCVLEFAHLDGEGWITVQNLLTHGTKGTLREILRPLKAPMRVPMDRPVAAALLLLVPIVGAELGLFRWTYRDDFFLRSVSVAAAPPNAEEVARIDRIYKNTVQESFPSTDRLVLLSSIFGRIDRPNELGEVVRLLAPRDRSNLDLQLALARAHDQHENYEEAAAAFQKLLEALKQGHFPASRREELLVAAARSYVHAGDLDHAADLFHEVLRAYPQDFKYRNEYAGVLLGGDRMKEALRLYEGIEPDYDGRLLLVLIHTSLRDYDSAAREVRSLLRERPGDVTAAGLLADVLNLQGNRLQAQAIYLRLLGSGVDDLKIGIQLAHGSLWSKNYQEALERFQAVLDQHRDDPALVRNHPEIFKAYVNAAASAPKLGESQQAMTVWLFERALTETEADPSYLARLAWVLHRLDEKDKSAVLLERAKEMAPSDPAIRRQLASVLIAAGRPEEALKQLEGHATDIEARTLLADTYAMNKDFAAAAKTCRAILQDNPRHAETRLKLANILSWNKEYPESLAILGDLVKTEPDNPIYAIRQAEVTLWSGDSVGATERYERLLENNFDRPVLWWGFVDAAAAATRLNQSQVRVARAISDKSLDGAHKSERVVEAFRKEGRELNEDSFLTRLAWILHKHAADTKRASALLDRAIALRPGDPARRKELAGVLAALNRGREALVQYEGLALEPRDRLNIARIHAAAREFGLAAQQCRLALSKQPLDRESQTLLADVLSWGKQYSEALELIDTLLRAYPDDANLLLRRAQVTLWSGHPVQALELFQPLVERGMDDPALRLGYLDAAGQSERLTPEQERLARKLTERPIEAIAVNQELMARAAWVLKHHLNDATRARALLEQAAALPSDDPAGLCRLAWILVQVGEKPTAQQVLKRAVALKPTEPAICRELAGVLCATQQFHEARHLYESLANADAKDRNLQIARAEVTLWSGDRAAALTLFQKLLEADFQQPRVWRGLVDAAGAVSPLTAAQMKLLDRIADGVPPVDTVNEKALFWSRLAWVFLRESAREPALRKRADNLLEKAVALGPIDKKTRAELAGTLTAAGRARDALPWLEEQARDNPNDVELQTQVARVTLWAGQPAKALERLGALLRANPERQELWQPFVDAASSAAKGVLTPAQVELMTQLAQRPSPASVANATLYQARLAWVLLREGRKESANALLDKALAAPSTDVAVQKELAGLLMAFGRNAAALKRLRELAAIDPQDATLQVQLAQATLWSGDAPAALVSLEKLLGANFQQPALWLNFVDACSGLNKGTMTRDQIALAVRIAAAAPPETAPDPVLYLSRLAWTLFREDQSAMAARLLDQAIALKPQQPATRRELAGVLVAVGRNEAGLALYDGLTLNMEDRFQLMVLHAATRNFREAEQQCQAILQTEPNDKRARRWQADLALWSSQYATALRAYQQLLVNDFEQPALWLQVIEAAAAIERIDANQVKLALRIVDRLAPSTEEPIALARMALLLRRHVERPAEGPMLATQTLAMLSSSAQSTFVTTSTLLAGQRRPTASGGLLTRALAHRPSDVTGLTRLSWLVYRLGDGPESVHLLDAAIALKPPEPGVRREVGDVLVATRRLREALAWFEDLAKTYPDNPGLQRRLAEVTVWAGEYERGLQRVEMLLAARFDDERSLWSTFVDAASSARTMTESQVEIALKLVDKPIPHDTLTAQVTYRSRLAWALLREGQRAKSAQWQTAANHLLDAAVEARCDDLTVLRELSGVLTAARRFQEAQTYYAELVRAFAADFELQLRLAEVTLWGGDTERGLARFAALAHENGWQERVWKGYVNAIAVAPSLSAEQIELVNRLADRLPSFADAAEEIEYLSRLAWAMHRESKMSGNAALNARAITLAERALELKPNRPTQRRELAGVLAAVGKHAAALELLDGAAATPADRRMRISLYAANQQLDEGEQEARKLAAARPDDIEAQYLLADVLCWNKKPGEAARIYETLLKATPTDARLRRKLAETSLWAGRANEALAQYQRLLADDWEQPDLWVGYIDAAAATKVLPVERHKALLLRIQERAADSQDPVFLMRLGGVMRRIDEPRRGLVLLKRALDLDPRSREVRTRLAEALQAAGNFAEAERHFEILLKQANTPLPVGMRD